MACLAVVAPLPRVWAGAWRDASETNFGTLAALAGACAAKRQDLRGRELGIDLLVTMGAMILEFVWWKKGKPPLRPRQLRSLAPYYDEQSDPELRHPPRCPSTPR